MFGAGKGGMIGNENTFKNHIVDKRDSQRALCNYISLQMLLIPTENMPWKWLMLLYAIRLHIIF